MMKKNAMSTGFKVILIMLIVIITGAVIIGIIIPKFMKTGLSVDPAASIAESQCLEKDYAFPIYEAKDGVKGNYLYCANCRYECAYYEDEARCKVSKMGKCDSECHWESTNALSGKCVDGAVEETEIEISDEEQSCSNGKFSVYDNLADGDYLECKTCETECGLYKDENVCTSLGSEDPCGHGDCIWDGVCKSDNSDSAGDYDAFDDLKNQDSILPQKVLSPQITPLTGDAVSPIDDEKFQNCINQVIAYADDALMRNCKYVKGATGPNSYDCSGLVIAAFDSADIYIKARSSGDQRLYAKNKKLLVKNSKAIAAGDVIFYSGHVAICETPNPGGGCEIIHAAGRGKGIRKGSISSNGKLGSKAYLGHASFCTLQP